MAEEQSPEVLDDIRGFESISMEEATSILGEQTRMEIIVELGKAWDKHHHQQQKLRFSELMEAVGLTDSGQFNYHLDKLVGSFVAKSDDGYWLPNHGMKLYRLIVSGTFTEREIHKDIDVDDCLSCGGTVRATYRNDNTLVFTCGECATGYAVIPFSPGGFTNRTDDDALQAAFRSFYSELRLARQGICPACDGTMETKLVTDLNERLDSLSVSGVISSLKCSVCNNYYYSDLSSVALTTDEVRRFLIDSGLEPPLVREWNEVTVGADESVTVVEKDPLRVEITFAVEDEVINVTFDSDHNVVSSTRSVE
ncbi:hypothetical protein KU306_16835 (plasmid) [Haloferax larsenii]|uniref:Helix-turn-helix domain-containing protein n=1 Tax=Haloferax larsenii TaxID=302484 RepID=A0ABY5RJ86_HALLR|nr:hypothetical protein [Haloferax larsenii]UVE51988.1 hypothetical protein KU306_16835 [Haloferax larsenii]